MKVTGSFSPSVRKADACHAMITLGTFKLIADKREVIAFASLLADVAAELVDTTASPTDLAWRDRLNG